jgi:glycosyltransferase involved in cell wall biosynthesis
VTPASLESARVSAYIPCFNNAATISLAIEGMRRQSHPIDDFFVVDDGSADNSAAVVEGLGVRVIRQGANLGRGAARATAMEAAQNEFVLCGDATNSLSPDFLRNGLKWFADERVVAICGRCCDRTGRSVTDRWRARHLYKQHVELEPNWRGAFSTFGAIVRKSAVMQAGNYDRNRRHGEDHELGGRLLQLGSVIADPALEIQPVIRNTLFQVMERYARWNRAGLRTYDLRAFISSHVVAWRILIPIDLAHRDLPGALISAAMPYFCLAYADKKSFGFLTGSTAKP